MKMTFKAKVVVDINTDGLEPTYRQVMDLLVQDKCSVEFIAPWSNDNEPTLIITEKE